MLLNYNYNCKPSPHGENRQKTEENIKILVFPAKVIFNKPITDVTREIKVVKTVLF